MRLNANLLIYTIVFNIVNGLLLGYAMTNPGGEVGMQMYVLFPLFHIIGIVGLIIIGVKNKTDFKQPGNWILAFFCTPVPTIIAVNLIVGPLR